MWPVLRVAEGSGPQGERHSLFHLEYSVSTVLLSCTLFSGGGAFSRKNSARLEGKYCSVVDDQPIGVCSWMDIRMSLHHAMGKLSWPVAESVSGIILGCSSKWMSGCCYSTPYDDWPVAEKVSVIISGSSSKWTSGCPCTMLLWWRELMGCSSEWTPGCCYSTPYDDSPGL